MVENREKRFNQCVVEKETKGLNVPEFVVRVLIKALGLNTGSIQGKGVGVCTYN